MSLDFTTRNTNIILFKIDEVENDYQNKTLLNWVCRIIRAIADPSFKKSDVSNVYRLGRKSPQIRPIMLQLVSGAKRSLLLRSKKKFTEKNIGISEDLPKDISEWRKSLYELADTLRKEGKKVLFRIDKFIVDGIELNENK